MLTKWWVRCWNDLDSESGSGHIELSQHFRVEVKNTKQWILNGIIP